MKYVILDECIPIIFSGKMKHSDFKNIGNHKCTSAGFMLAYVNDNTDKIEISVWGVSTSLNLVSKEKDSIILKEYITDIY